MFGIKVSSNDFRCGRCIDVCTYERETNSNDRKRRCTYCKGPVWFRKVSVNV